MREAPLAQTDAGLRPEGEGWFILNVADAAWQTDDNGGTGTWSLLEPDDGRFGQFGIGVHVLPPGEAPGLYHWESDQEGFLVLSGACVAIVEGQERPMRRWDYLHCPPGTRHILVGAAGDELCAILMVGARTPDKLVRYPADPVAAAHGASVDRDADHARDAYAQVPGWGRFRTVRAPWPAPDAAA
ncbi:MAG TPA: cupin domain-containing protein [Baekduia sp.]|uniref:cupin domain-containing protein n=1 Tax=Baekduia sp. TaxID=2600305 RepID=UPI002D7A2302|nr:cupin domain-containing protein [Baekduia sp.]HET6509666.1 cupin domain-containing protein [Baekduia sp.]